MLTEALFLRINNSLDNEALLFFYVAYFLQVHFSYARQTKQTEHINRLWFAYFNQTRFSDR